MALALMSGALTHTIGTEAPPEQREPILPPHTPDEIAQGELPEEMIATMVSRG